MLNISKILKELHCLFVKNKANSCKLSLKRTRKFINSLYNVNRINNMLLDFMYQFMKNSIWISRYWYLRYLMLNDKIQVQFAFFFHSSSGKFKEKFLNEKRYCLCLPNLSVVVLYENKSHN